LIVKVTFICFNSNLAYLFSSW